MRQQAIATLAFLLVAGSAVGQHCRKADIDKSTGYCTVPDHKLTPGLMDASLVCLWLPTQSRCANAP